VWQCLRKRGIRICNFRSGFKNVSIFEAFQNSRGGKDEKEDILFDVITAMY